MKLTVRQLQVFDAVVTSGSVTGAATKLNISQSAASVALADLQVVMGRPLFAHARGKRLQITDEGRRVQPIIRSLLGELQELETADIDAPLSGQLIIGATTFIAETVLPRLCVEFMTLHPDVKVHVEAESVGDLFERLHRFELETALIENFPAVEGIELVKWRTDELILVVAPTHPLAVRSNLRMTDLIGMKWCLREAQSSVSARLRYMLHEEVGQLDACFSSTSNWALRHAVRAGGGIGCLSRALVQVDLEVGRLIELRVQGFSFTRALSLARPKEIWRSRLNRAFQGFLLERGQYRDTQPIA
ncbi:MAG TPA: LysR family transcriptional regulator [Sphingobium sp.]